MLQEHDYGSCLHLGMEEEWIPCKNIKKQAKILFWIFSQISFRKRKKYHRIVKKKQKTTNQNPMPILEEILIFNKSLLLQI